MSAMVEWLWGKLEKERKVIKAAPIHFATACVASAIIFGIIWYMGFSVALGLKSNTIAAYKDRYGDLSNHTKAIK